MGQGAENQGTATVWDQSGRCIVQNCTKPYGKRSCRAGRTGWLWEVSALGVADHEHRHSAEAYMIAGFYGFQGD